MIITTVGTLDLGSAVVFNLLIKGICILTACKGDSLDNVRFTQNPEEQHAGLVMATDDWPLPSKMWPLCLLLGTLAGSVTALSERSQK